MKKGQALDEEGADECCCGHPETQAHLLSECCTREYISIRRLFAGKRAKLVQGSGLSNESKATLLLCFPPNRAGTYPDLRSPAFAWPPGDLAQALKLHTSDPLYFFSKGALPVDLLKNDRCGHILREGIDYLQTYAPTVSGVVVRIFYAIMAVYRVTVSSIDISTAYLYAKLLTLIYAC